MAFLRTAGFAELVFKKRIYLEVLEEDMIEETDIEVTCMPIAYAQPSAATSNSTLDQQHLAEAYEVN